jgi:methionyl-tRNA synthetase
MQAFLMNNQWVVWPLLAWALVWKGWALWIAARRGKKAWYVVLLVVNTLGLLEIIYIFGISKLSKKQ